MKAATGNRSQFSLLWIRGICQAILCGLTVISVAAQQQVIPLYKGVAPGSENWNWEEKEFFVKVPLNSKIAYNVTRPTLTVFRPDTPNGTAVIVCPGGGLQVLNIEREGINVAKELVKKGITVFVFKYRLVQSVTDDPWTEMRNNIANPDSFRKKTAVISSMARTDVNLAIAYVRQHAKEFKLDSTRIGLMGFSAGGVLSAWAAYNFMPETRPDFVAPIYCVISSIQERTVKPDAPPLFIVAASDDQLAPVSNSVNLYNDWINARRSAELHIYAKGGHGLRGAPAESWLDRFTEWLTAQGFLKAGQ
jgi:acetyl esterase/lipase